MKPEAPGLHGQWLARIWDRPRLSQIWQPSLDKDIAAKAAELQQPQISAIFGNFGHPGNSPSPFPKSAPGGIISV
jgi:hypothetical protein